MSSVPTCCLHCLSASTALPTSHGMDGCVIGKVVSIAFRLQPRSRLDIEVILTDVNCPSSPLPFGVLPSRLIAGYIFSWIDHVWSPLPFGVLPSRLEDPLRNLVIRPTRSPLPFGVLPSRLAQRAARRYDQI